MQNFAASHLQSTMLLETPVSFQPVNKLQTKQESGLQSQKIVYGSLINVMSGKLSTSFVDQLLKFICVQNAIKITNMFINGLFWSNSDSKSYKLTCHNIINRLYITTAIISISWSIYVIVRVRQDYLIKD